MKSIFLVLTIIGVLLSVKIVNKNEIKYITNFPGKDGPIIAFGDSLTEGISSSEGNDFVSVISENIGFEILNKGKSGDTTQLAIKRLEDDVLANSPRLVTILLGGNDYLRRIPKETTFSNLDEIINIIHKSGSMILLVGVQGGVLGDPYKREFRALAKKHNTAYITNILENIVGHSDLMYDSIHPNDRGYKIIADRIERVLIQIII